MTRGGFGGKGWRIMLKKKKKERLLGSIKGFKYWKKGFFGLFFFKSKEGFKNV